MTKPSTLTLLVSLTLALGPGCRDVPPEESAPRSLRVGVVTSQPPFVSRGEDDEPMGISVDMLRDLGVYLNTEVKLVSLSEEEMASELSENRVDLLLPPAAGPKENASGFLSTDPFAWVGLAMLTRPEQELATVEDLNQSGLTIGVIENTPGKAFANTSLPHPAVRMFEAEDAARDALIEGDLDALVLEQLDVHRLAGESPDRLRAVLQPFRREPRAFKVREEDGKLRDDLNEFIQDYREIGGFERLLERHIPEIQRDFQEAGAPLPFDPPEPAVPAAE